MKIKTLFKSIFCAGLALALVLYLCHLYGNYIEKTQEPITDYTYNGFEEKSNYKSSNTILITYKSKQYRLHTGDRILNKIKSGDFPKLYYSSKVSIQQTPYFPLWKFFLVLREFKTWNDEELDIRRI